MQLFSILSSTSCPSSDPVITMEPAPLHRIPLDEPCLLHCGQHSSSSQSVSLSLTTFGHRYKPISLYHLASIPDRFNCTAGNNNNMDTGLRQWPLFSALVDTTTGLLPGPLSADPYHPSSSPIILLLLWVVLLFVLCSMHCRRTPLKWWWSARRTTTRTLTTNVVKQILTRCQRRRNKTRKW